MLKPSTPTNTNNLVPSGTHIARLYSIVDMGRQETEWNGEKKLSHKVRFTWELPLETKVFDGETKPQVIGNQYTLSMGSKANLRPVIEGLLGVQLKDEEAANFDMEDFKKLLGTPCMVSVIHNSKGDKTYANISSVVPLPKGMTCPPQFNENQIYEIGTSTDEELESLPQFMQDTILKSQEMKIAGEEDKDYAEKISCRWLDEQHEAYVEVQPFDSEEQTKESIRRVEEKVKSEVAEKVYNKHFHGSNK